MKICTKILLVLLLFLGTYTSLIAQDNWLKELKKQKWLSQVSQIILLKSTRKDVERILRNPEFSERSFIEYYSTTNGRVTIHYSEGLCKTTEGELLESVVEEVRFSPSDNIKLSNLGLILSKFKKSKEEDTPIEIYTNQKEGVEIEVQNKEVSSITFTPSTKLNLECKTQ